jgi:hypothetical protein
MFVSTLHKSRVFNSWLTTTAKRAATTMSSNRRSLPHIVNVSPEEKSADALNWKNLEIATRALHHDGLVVLENAISHSKLDFLNKKMVQDALTLQSAGDNSPYNYNKGYISLILPNPQSQQPSF